MSCRKEGGGEAGRNLKSTGATECLGGEIGALAAQNHTGRQTAVQIVYTKWENRERPRLTTGRTLKRGNGSAVALYRVGKKRRERQVRVELAIYPEEALASTKEETPQGMRSGKREADELVTGENWKRPRSTGENQRNHGPSFTPDTWTWRALSEHAHNEHGGARNCRGQEWEEINSVEKSGRANAALPTSLPFVRKKCARRPLPCISVHNNKSPGRSETRM
ncbi:hypothetical protein TGMAS_220850 [Toxoplasma gondii MAS]|uniref:Uncharacterized protein n=1 Tax=Toxoplasma gondii MAS TaxID=943118 RepID=A0A086PKY2_TOXGO|nr:hypothetical protein TGMAS_220850 [Toxoplasma gondii MAS]